MHLNSVFCSHKRNIRTISHTILLLFFFGFCIYVINEHRYNLNQDYYKKKKPLRSIYQFKQCIEVAVVSVRSAFSLWMSLFLLQNTLTDDDALRENWQMSTFVFCLFLLRFANGTSNLHKIMGLQKHVHKVSPTRHWIHVSVDKPHAHKELNLFLQLKVR